MAIPKQIKPLGVTDKFIHGLIVAPPGFGKTVFAGTASKALFITTDPEGTVSAYMMGSTAQEWEVAGWKEIDQCYLYLKNGGIEEMGLEWLIVDNTSEALQMARDECIALSRVGNAKIDEYVLSQQGYQRSQNMLLKLVKQINDLPVNVLWTSWQASEEDQDGEVYFAPAIHGQQGAIAQSVAGVMNVVGYGQVIEKDGKEVRRLHFSHNGPYRGKDRYQALGRAKDDLTVDKMKSLIDAKLATRKGAKKTTTSTKTGAAPVRRRRPTSTRKAS
jgi:hypothetical protein